jgi:hypothetical protein
MPRKDSESEVASKVVAIMQTITEDLDDEGRRALRKLLGIPKEQETSQDETQK